MDGATLLICASLFALDGDSILCDGVNMRDMGDGKPFVSGYDAPELGRAQCHEERRLAVEAKKRMQELLGVPGVEVWDSGERDKFKRPLVWVLLPDGVTVGSILVQQKLARTWTKDYVASWCPPKGDVYFGPAPHQIEVPSMHLPKPKSKPAKNHQEN